MDSKKVERLMCKHEIVGIARRRRRGLTRRAKRAVFALDLIGRDFIAPWPGMRLAGGMTELVMLEGELHLVAGIALATREVGGRATANHHRAELPVVVLWMVAGRSGPDVLFGQVCDATGWWVAADAGVGSVVVVPVQPVGKRCLPLGV
ncbi:integrase catalytic region [Streptomyces sp. OM5714]|nr:integrase catalytic region [Streptomyces sp. OM5714]